MVRGIGTLGTGARPAMLAACMIGFDPTPRDRFIFRHDPMPEPVESERRRPWELSRSLSEGPCTYRATGSKRTRRRNAGRHCIIICGRPRRARCRCF